VLAEWGPLTPAEAHVLAGFRRRRSQDQGEVEAAADSPGATTEPSGADSPGEEGNADVDDFFAQGDDDDDGGDGGGDGAGDDGGDEVADELDSALPAALLSLALLDAPQRADAASLLVELPLRLQGQIVNLIVTSSVQSATWGLEAEECDLVEGMRGIMAAADSWGVLPACEILRAIDTTRRLRRAISSTATIDEDAVTILQNHLFVFADVIRLNDRELQALLNKIANPQLARALSEAPEGVRDRLLGNMSPRRSMLVGEEGEYLGEITPEEVEADQRDILETLRHMYETGEISTYFGSVRGNPERAEQPSSDGTAFADADDDLDQGQPELDPGTRPGAEGKQDEVPAASALRPRKIVLGLAVVAGTGLLVLVTMRMTEVGQPRSSRQGAANSTREGHVVVQSQQLSDEQASDRIGGSPSPTADEVDDSDAMAQITAVLEFAGKAGGGEGRRGAR